MTKEQMQSMNSHDHTNMQGKHKSHRLMMIACCIPMFAIALVLVFTGVVGASFLFFAVICTLMMVAMMGGMNHGTR